MNTTDYFTYINAMFLFCIFTCGLLLAVGWKLVRKSEKLKEEQDSHLKATNTNTLLNKALSAKNASLQANEHKLRDAEKEIRELQAKLDHAEADRIELRAERATLENKLTDALAKVRKRDKDGKFLPSGNSTKKCASVKALTKGVEVAVKRIKEAQSLKLVTDLGENDVIRCSTFKQAEKLHKLDSRIKIEHWEVYKKDTAFRPYDSAYSGVQFYEDHGYTIHPASDFIARPKRVKKVKSAVNELTDAFDQIKAESPKLIHGLTVKNPTEDEAKMIRDNAEILGIKKTDSFKSPAFPSLWYYVSENEEGEIVSCADNANPIKIFVTAKEFVQRMQNGRG